MDGKDGPSFRIDLGEAVAQALLQNGARMQINLVHARLDTEQLREMNGGMNGRVDELGGTCRGGSVGRRVITIRRAKMLGEEVKESVTGGGDIHEAGRADKLKVIAVCDQHDPAGCMALAQARQRSAEADEIAERTLKIDDDDTAAANPNMPKKPRIERNIRVKFAPCFDEIFQDHPEFMLRTRALKSISASMGSASTKFDEANKVYRLYRDRRLKYFAACPARA